MYYKFNFNTGQLLLDQIRVSRQTVMSTLAEDPSLQLGESAIFDTVTHQISQTKL